MGRKIMRVPLDFDYPLHQVWYGYQIMFCNSDLEDGCERCRKFAEILGIPQTKIVSDYSCPMFKEFYRVDPPYGKGYQLWETTTEGSPISPVFEAAEELASWCAENATIFADRKMTFEEWLKMIKGSK